MLRALPFKECPPTLVLLIWALWAVFQLALLPLIGTKLADPDDYMRLLQVRDLLAGQSWFDVTQHRMGLPDGASMHWSRLVDLPLAGLILLFDTVLPGNLAELWAMALIPLLWLLLALLALRDIAKSLELPPLATLLMLLLFPMFPLLPGNFAPLRIDHHTAQSVAAVVCGALLLHTGSRRAAIACGLAGALWTVVSIEALPMLVTLTGLYGLGWALNGDRSLSRYLVSLTGGSAMLSLATRPLSDLTGPHCDVLRPGHIAAFAVATLVALWLQFIPERTSKSGRLTALGLLPVAVIPVAFASLGSCATNPLGQLDPLLQTWWHAGVLEGLPVWHQPPSMALVLAWTIAIIAAGWRLVHQQQRQSERWNLLAGLALVCGIYSLLIAREGLAAQLLAIPFAALLLAHWLPLARAIPRAAPRIVATAAVIVLCTPTFGSALVKPFDQAISGSATIASDSIPISCDYSALNRLPPSHIFTPLDRGPEILALTDHTVVAGPYHRNQARMVDVITAFTGRPAEAESIVRRNGASFVVACLGSTEILAYREARADNLANLLSTNHPPDWLLPVPEFNAGPLRAYRVR
jgi:hypothetical protein